MKKVYGIVFATLFLGSNPIGCVVKQKTAYEIAISLSETLSPSMTKNAIAELMAQAKIQAEENGVDEKDVVNFLVWKVDEKLRYYKNSLVKPKTVLFNNELDNNVFYDSDTLLVVGTLGIILNSLFYYSTPDYRRGHVFDSRDIRIDSATGGLFVSKKALEFIANDRINDSSKFFSYTVISAIAFTWGAYLKIWKWYAEACCKKYSVIRNDINQHMNTLDFLIM
jgi:hypothetical protein